MHLLMEFWKEGLQKCNTFQRAKATKMCPIVAVTAFTHDDVVNQVKVAKISEVIYKPVDCETLRRIIDRYYYKIE